MITIGSIGFLQPWVLAALAALPAIWWLLRLTPPSPQLVVFPPTRLLKDLKTTEEDAGAEPLVADGLAHAARRFDHPCARAARAQSRPAKLRRRRPPPHRHRQWLGLGRALARTPRGDRSGDRPRRARRPHHRACALCTRPAGQRSLEPRQGTRARRRHQSRALRTRSRRACRDARKGARRKDGLQRAVALRRSRLRRRPKPSPAFLPSSRAAAAAFPCSGRDGTTRRSRSDRAPPRAARLPPAS